MPADRDQIITEYLNRSDYLDRSARDEIQKQKQNER